MRIEPRAFALAAGTAAAILFTVCAVGVFLVPDLTTAVLGFLTYTDLSGIRRRATASIGFNPWPNRAMVSRFRSSSP